jgi:prepilin-type N-terminal cleavage/methylation domain-containing protein
MLTATKPHRHAPRGFTLIELMTVVIIVAVLATVAVFAVRKYVFSAKTAEAYQMINSIRSAQEAYRAETFAYCDVSGGSLALANSWPKASPGLKAAWDDGSCTDATCIGFRTLGVMPNGAVLFRYSSVAGTGAPSTQGTPAHGFSLPTTGAGPWYVVQALGDQNGDGVYSVFLSSSLSSDVYSEHDTE